MAYSVIVTEAAERDIDEILQYLCVKLENPKAASDFVVELEHKYTELVSFPKLFEVSRNVRLAEKGYHRFVVGSYVALYLIDEPKQVVTIARVFYGRRDYQNYI